MTIKECVVCGRKFKPNSNSQRYCKDCKIEQYKHTKMKYYKQKYKKENKL